jgi:hypothetical protein
VLSERPVDGARVARVGPEVGPTIGRDLEEVLETVEVRQRQPQLPAAGHVGQVEGDAEVDVAPQPHAVECVLGVRQPKGDMVALRGGGGELLDGGGHHSTLTPSSGQVSQPQERRKWCA